MASTRTCTAFMILFLVASTGLSSSVRAAEKAPVDVEDMPLKPAPVGKPQSTIGAGARGGAEDLPDVFVLAPPSTGATCKTQPTIFWYLTGDTGQDIEMTVAQASDGRLIFTKKIEGRRKAGVYSLNFAEEKNLVGEPLALRQDVQYQVTVTVKKFKEDVQNPHSVGLIAAVARPAELRERPDGRECAGAGLWYDAVFELIDRLSKDPASVQSRRQLCGLVWAQHVFYAHDDKIDAAAQERAKEKERERMKEFRVLKFDQLK